MTPEQIATECRTLADRLQLLSGEFSAQKWKEHSQVIFEMTHTLAICARQIEAKVKI